MATLAQKISKLNIDDVIFSVMNTEETKKTIIELNQEQLSVLGVDFEGKPLKTYKANGGNVYSNYTIKDRKLRGKQYDHVDLFDKGDFYKTFSTITDKAFTEVKGNTKKGDEDISFNLDISKIFGLTKESKSELIQYLRVPARKAFRKALNGM